MLPTIEIFGVLFSTYWLCGLAALLFSGTLVFANRRAFSIGKSDLFQLVSIVLVGAAAGAKLFSVIGGMVLHGREAWFWTVENWGGMLRSGGVYYGGVIGAAIAGFILMKRRGMNLRNTFDLMALFPPAFDAVGRFGCLLAGCCYGVEVQHMFTVPGTVYEVPRVPSPLLESTLNLLILVYFLAAKPERRLPGARFPLYLFLYSAGRFGLEFFRGDENRGVFLLSTSQWIAILLILASALWIYLDGKRSGKSKLRLAST